MKKGKIQGYNLIQFGGKERQGEKGNKNLGHIYIYIYIYIIFIFIFICKNFCDECREAIIHNRNEAKFEILDENGPPSLGTWAIQGLEVL